MDPFWNNLVTLLFVVTYIVGLINLGARVNAAGDD